MALHPKPGGANVPQRSTMSAFCISEAIVELEHSSASGVWWRLPAVAEVRETVNRQTATEIRHSDTGGVFTQACQAESKSYQYQVDAYYFTADPIEWYVKDGVSYTVRAWRDAGAYDADGDTDADSNYGKKFTASFDDDGNTWSNQSNDPELRTLLFDATEAPKYINPLEYPVGATPIPPHAPTGADPQDTVAV